eukprot:TRINITY_DN15431_c0_g1_i1.p1 TRINITY_DN15431_c0_g1~~TRINITY_DN15431_c0_g1_i1.p1  ORF type:complete len:678 (+),score=138.30 TRINITY_DN15431_c0_g1_i1:93-2126(+)
MQRDTSLRETGPTGPMCTDGPTPEEAAMSRVFEEHIEQTKEPLEAAKQRERTLSWLDQVVKQWVAELAVAQGRLPADAQQLGGRIFTFGSYRLGVHGPGADIDTLVVGPRHCRRADFFDTFVAALGRHGERVTDIVPVPDAGTPVLKVKIDGISMDILFASIDRTAIPDTFRPTDDDVLRNVDESTQRSLNGTRVATKLLHCVPNVETFRSVLRGVKKWATARGVYGNVYGYPGGIAWAILVARACQLYPNQAPGVVFGKFFKYFAMWWKENPTYPTDLNNPIFLTGSLDVDLEFGFKVWNRTRYTGDRYEVLPIITPCYPFMNTCYNTTVVTLKVMCDELKRATHLYETMWARDRAVDFDALWEHSDFKWRYAQYLVVSAAGTTPDAARRWAGFCESRLRRMLSQLALVPYLTANIWPKMHEREVVNRLTGTTTCEHSWFIGLDYQTPPNTMGRQHVSLGNAWHTFMSYVAGAKALQAQNPFQRTGEMLDPRHRFVLRKELPEACAYALTDDDRKGLARHRQQLKQDRKRRRERAGVAAAAAVALAAVAQQCPDCGGEKRERSEELFPCPTAKRPHLDTLGDNCSPEAPPVPSAPEAIPAAPGQCAASPPAEHAPGPCPPPALSSPGSHPRGSGEGSHPRGSWGAAPHKPAPRRDVSLTDELIMEAYGLVPRGGAN